MKALRVLLFILILAGIVLLCTQKIWVQRFVNKILLPENLPVVVRPTQVNFSLQDGRQCYTYSHDATPDAPYAVSEFVDMTIKGKVVTGTKTGTQNGPDMTNGYQGTLSGTLDNDTITDVFAYTVEGSQNKEKEIYRTSKTGIEKLRYPLMEQERMLVPDTTKEFETLNYARVGCAASH